MTRDDMIFPTKKDEEAFQEALTRAIFPISSNITNIQTVKHSKKCQTEDDCGNNADFKITRREDQKYDQNICINCIENQIQDWQNEMLENLKQRLDRYKTAKKL